MPPPPLPPPPPPASSSTPLTDAEEPVAPMLRQSPPSPLSTAMRATLTSPPDSTQTLSAPLPASLGNNKPLSAVPEVTSPGEDDPPSTAHSTLPPSTRDDENDEEGDKLPATPPHGGSRARLARMPRAAMSPSSSSITSSPRRPRRAGTALPNSMRSGTRFSASDLDPPDIMRERGARDEFEEEFLNQVRSDGDEQLISRHLEAVDFRQLSDDEEVLSDGAADTSRGEEAARHSEKRRKEAEREKNAEAGRGETAKERRASTVRSNWRRIPSEVGCRGCEGCARLYGENRSLRRQLDELEFELASGVLHNPADGFDPPTVMKAVPTIPQLPMSGKKRRKGWGGKFGVASSVSGTGGRGKPSEKGRLQSEVKALTVTTEYLWRKLNKAEVELRDYRLRDLRNRMKMSAVGANSEPNATIINGDE